jgi:hypothetical protein
MLTHRFNLQIGDWSGDGHGRNISYLIDSNKPIEEVRKAFYKAQEKFDRAVWPTSLCDRYQTYSITEEVANKIVASGYTDPLGDFDEDDKVYYVEVDELATYTLWFITQGDPTLGLVHCQEEIPSFHFYGYQDGKHIDGIGYGLFGP